LDAGIFAVPVAIMESVILAVVVPGVVKAQNQDQVGG
jgi:hypothetical protein